MIDYKKILVIAGASLLLGGCSIDINGLLNGTLQNDNEPTPSPYTESQTQDTLNQEGGSMGSNSYNMQGTATIGDGDDDETLEKDLNDIEVNSKLEMMVQ